MREFLERICSALLTGMTSTITKFVGKRKSEAKCMGFDPLVEVATSPTKRRVAAASTGGRAYVGTNIPASMLVGGHDWMVFYEDDSEKGMEQRLKVLEARAARADVLEQEVKGLEQGVKGLKQDVGALKSENASHAQILGDLYVSNVAGEVLQFAIGEQPKAAGPCSRFRALARRKDPKLANFVQELNTNVLPLPTTVNDVAKAFDSVIDWRNSEVHNASVVDLVSKVNIALNFLQCHPSLMKKFQREHLVLANFGLIRKSFCF